MNFSEDILQIVPNEDLANLKEFYRNFPADTHIFGFLSIVVDLQYNSPERLKDNHPESGCITVYAPHGNWRPDGTFVALLKFSCYDFMVYTKEESCERLYESLVKTKRFNYTAYRTLFYGVHRLHFSKVYQAVLRNEIPVEVLNECYLFYKPKSSAINFSTEIPDDVFLSKLLPEHIPVVNSLWPHRFETSEQFLTELLKIGGGYALFLKESGEIVSWIFRSQVRGLSMLETKPEFKRRGYGSALVRYLSKELALEGFDPVATVLTKNSVSMAMFKKLGFEILNEVTFIECMKL